MTAHESEKRTGTRESRHAKIRTVQSRRIYRKVASREPSFKDNSSSRDFSRLLFPRAFSRDIERHRGMSPPTEARRATWPSRQRPQRTA
jgi:hypothetical protein